MTAHTHTPYVGDFVHSVLAPSDSTAFLQIPTCLDLLHSHGFPLTKHAMMPISHLVCLLFIVLARTLFFLPPHKGVATCKRISDCRGDWAYAVVLRHPTNAQCYLCISKCASVLLLSLPFLAVSSFSFLLSALLNRPGISLRPHAKCQHVSYGKRRFQRQGVLPQTHDDAHWLGCRQTDLTTLLLCMHKRVTRATW